MDKKNLRIEIRAAKRSFSADQLSQKSARVVQDILRSQIYLTAQCILLYHPLPDEVDTRAIICEAYSGGKTVVLPVVVGNDLELRLYSPDTMVKGAFGIMEPSGELFTDYDSIDLAIVPGMGFDAANHRLGRGKGYYDRLLPRLTRAVKMGVCFDFQLLDSVPCEPHDVVMDKVVWGIKE